MHRTLSRATGLAVAVALGCFAAPLMAYPGGTPGFQTDAAPYCASCHSSTSEAMLAGAPGNRATKELAENKHLAGIVGGSKPYAALSPQDRATLAEHVRALDAATSVKVTAPLKVKAGDTFTVSVDVTGGSGPVVGVALVDQAHRWQARPAPGVGWAIVKPPTIIGQDFQEQDEWLGRRNGEANLAYVNVTGIRSDAAKQEWGRAQVVWTLRAPPTAGDLPMAAVLFYGTEKGSPLGVVEDPIRGRMLRGGIGGASGRILFFRRDDHRGAALGRGRGPLRSRRRRPADSLVRRRASAAQPSRESTCMVCLCRRWSAQMALPAEIPAVEDIRFNDIEFWAQPGPHREAAFEALRRAPGLVYQEEFEVPAEAQAFMPQGPGYFSAVRHEDVLEVSRNADLFCSGRGTQIMDQPESFNDFFGSMINMDDPKHGRLRRIVSRGFTPRALARLEHDVERRAKATVDRLLELGRCDFVKEVAAPLPLEIVCDIMGIPESQTAFVFEQTNVILGLGDPEYVPPGQNAIVAALTAGKGLADLMNEIADARRSRPTDDLTSQLIHAEVEGEALGPMELASFFILLVVAGNETTRNAISHGMKALCDHPDERARWAADFEGLAETAIDEIVRWSSPVIHFRRTATRDTELRGTRIEEGQKIVLWYASANRDALAFDEPYRFDVGRTPNEHVGFGGPGPHYCLGANLAKREMRVIFRELFRRAPGLEITGEPDFLRSMFIHGIKHMPCEVR